MASAVVDASRLCVFHPMLALRLRLFIDWHLDAGQSVHMIPPSDPTASQRLADLGVASGLAPEILDLPEPQGNRLDDVLPLARFVNHTQVEDIARDAVELLHRQTDPFGSWGEALYQAISELCDNALQHGRHDLGAYIVADRVLEPQRMMRLAIADLGIGIPEHIRTRHPEWHEDSAAIAKALDRGVSGTGDPARGNGLAEMIDAALETDLVRASSAADIDIRASRGRVGMQIVGGTKIADRRSVDRPRRGTWITYTVSTA